MTNGVDRELGETDARLSALEKRMATMEGQNAEMIKVLYMGRGVIWVSGIIAAGTALVATLLTIVAQIRGN